MTFSAVVVLGNGQKAASLLTWLSFEMGRHPIWRFPFATKSFIGWIYLVALSESISELGSVVVPNTLNLDLDPRLCNQF